MFDQPMQIMPDASKDGVQTPADTAVAPCLLPSGHNSLVLSLTPTPTLLVMNLPVFLFSQTTDLHPLLLPFGKIHKLEILPVIPGQSPGTLRVVVEYCSSSCAKEAKETIQGQYYSNCAVAVEFLASESTSPQVQDAPAGGAKTSNLNPYAPAFVSDTPPYLATPLVYRSAGSLTNILPPQTNTLVGSQYPFSHGPNINPYQDMRTRSGLGSKMIDAGDRCIRHDSSKSLAPRGFSALTDLSNAMNIDPTLENRFF